MSLFIFYQISVLSLLLHFCECEELKLVRTSIYRPIVEMPRYERPKSTLNSTGNDIIRVAHRIYHGYDCPPKDYPSMVAILKETTKNKLTLFCGASLITKKFVLTAGHCASEYIYAGVLMETEHEYIQQISAYYLHPKFDLENLDNDVCVMVLSKPLNIKEVRFTKLPEKSIRKDMTDICKQQALVMGWGKTDELPAAGTLQCAKLPIITMADCIRLYGSAMRGSEKETFCTLSGEGKDACTGDSGGPVFCGDLQIGIVSWGMDCGEPESPGVFARTDYFSLFFKNVQKVETKYEKIDVGKTKARGLRSGASKSLPLSTLVLTFTVFVCFLLLKY